MSHVGHDLARIYSEEKVVAARDCLAQRGDQTARIEADAIQAMRVTEELAARLAEVEDQEEQTTGRIARLRTELEALLPRLGLALDPVQEATPKAPPAPLAEKAECENRTSGQLALHRRRERSSPATQRQRPDLQ